jgi:hypothetical protein
MANGLLATPLLSLIVLQIFVGVLFIAGTAAAAAFPARFPPVRHVVYRERLPFSHKRWQRSQRLRSCSSSGLREAAGSYRC